MAISADAFGGEDRSFATGMLNGVIGMPSLGASNLIRHLYRILSSPVCIGQIVHKDEVFARQHPAIVDLDPWQAVQAQMKANQQGHRTKANSTQPSLLTGLVFDECGHRRLPLNGH